jgi:hypothetical protein
VTDDYPRERDSREPDDHSARLPRPRCTEAGVQEPGAHDSALCRRWRPTEEQFRICHGHGRVRVARDQAAGLKVYDDRGAT